MWQEVSPSIHFDGHVFLLGDFNEILHLFERFNCEEYTNLMMAFQDFINNIKLLEFLSQGSSFTWYDSVCRSIIDRCFISLIASKKWPNMMLSTFV